MKQVFPHIMVFLIMLSCSKVNEESSIVVADGVLSEVITDDNKYNVTSLTVSGTISGEDWELLFEMALMGRLEVLDLTDAKIIGVPDSDSWNDDSIPRYEFYKSKTLKEVYLPNTLKVIGEEAFADCKVLSTVHFPESIDSIGPRAFYNTRLSGELKTPTNLRVIAPQAFARTKLTKVIITTDIIAGETIIQEEDSDGNISNYNSIYVIGGNSVFAYCESISEVIVNEGCTLLDIGFEHCSSLSKVSLPSTLRQIGRQSINNGNYIFKDCVALESILLPDELTAIGHQAFDNTHITDIVIPDKVQKIGSFAFHNCSHLKAVKLPSQLKEIAFKCFEGCSSLSEIIIPGEEAIIADNAFSDCSALKSVAFGEGITKIGDSAFSNCTMLQTAILPSCLTMLGTSAFEGCSSLISVRIPDNLEQIESVTFKDCTALHDLTIGSSVTSIGAGAFFHCPKLETIELPNSISIIESYAFAYSGIKEMMVKWYNPLPISEDTFLGVALSKATLVVPVGATESYRHSSVWDNFGQIKER